MTSRTVVKMLLALICLSLGGQAQAALVEFSDDFETGSDGWTTVSAGVTTAFSKSPTHSMYVISGNGKHAYHSMGSALDEQFEISYSFYAETGTLTNAGGTFNVGVLATGGFAYNGYQIQTTLQMDASGSLTIKAYNGTDAGGSYDAAVSVSADAWHDVRIVATSDSTNGGTYSWYLDGAPQGIGLGFGDPSGGLPAGITSKAELRRVATKQVAAHHGGTQDRFTGLIDDVAVTVPEPASACLIGLGGLLMMIRSRRTSKP